MNINFSGTPLSLRILTWVNVFSISMPFIWGEASSYTALLSLDMFKLWLSWKNTESETNPSNNLKMRQADLSPSLFQINNGKEIVPPVIIDIESRKGLFLYRNILRVSDNAPLKSLCPKCQRLEIISAFARKC